MAFGWPKLGRSSRSFLREVVIVLLGVLIALALEQVAADWRDARRGADIRASMDEEIADFSEVFRIRLAAARCVTAKLDALDRILAQGGARGPWTDVGRPPFYFASRGAWNSDASDLLGRHLGPATLRIYGEIYQGMEEFGALTQEEQDFWIALQTLERQDEPLAGDRRWQLIEAAAGARNANLLLTAITEQMLANARRLGIAPNRALAGLDLRSRPICRPLGRENNRG
jgi:hypothetical protein